MTSKRYSKEPLLICNWDTSTTLGNGKYACSLTDGRRLSDSTLPLELYGWHESEPEYLWLYGFGGLNVRNNYAPSLYETYFESLHNCIVLESRRCIQYHMVKIWVCKFNLASFHGMPFFHSELIQLFTGNHFAPWCWPRMTGSKNRDTNHYQPRANI